MSFAQPKSRNRSIGAKIIAVFQFLKDFEVGSGRTPESLRIPPAKLADLLRLLLMLLQNGLSLPKALTSLADDKAARKWATMLHSFRRAIQQGGSLSDAMAKYPRTFTPVQIQQIRIGERTGALQRALDQVCTAMERSVATRRKVIKKLSYPCLVMLAGFGLICFMVTYVVPQFEEVFTASKVDLPTITLVVSGLSKFLLNFGPLVLLGVILSTIAFFVVRRQAWGRMMIDRAVLQIPMFGGWIRDAAALQFADATMSMIESGYTPVEAVEASVPCVRNRSVRKAVTQVCLGVKRGERLSTEMERYPELFPATLCQLIHVGEQSGDFGNAMVGACRHLRQHLERRIDTTVSAIEPIMTLGLAGLIGSVVLAIYLPMFHMFEVLE